MSAVIFIGAIAVSGVFAYAIVSADGNNLNDVLPATIHCSSACGRITT